MSNTVELYKNVEKITVFCSYFQLDKDDPRYGSDEASKDMRIALSSLEKCTHKFIREHSELSTKVEFLKYKNYVEQRENIRSQQTGNLC